MRTRAESMGDDSQSQAPLSAAPISDQYRSPRATTKPFEAQALAAEPAVEARDDASPCRKMVERAAPDFASERLYSFAVSQRSPISTAAITVDAKLTRLRLEQEQPHGVRRHLEDASGAATTDCRRSPQSQLSPAD